LSPIIVSFVYLSKCLSSSRICWI